jgi:rhamnosyltransferase
MNDSNKPDISIAAVIVLYNPDFKKISKLISQIEHQIRYIVFVDNTVYSDVESTKSRLFHPKVHYIPLGDNLGIATAQNTGIRHCLSLTAPPDFFIFLDQDSFPVRDMIKSLYNSYCRLTFSGFLVGAIGATPINKATSRPYNGNVGHRKRINNSLMQVSELMSSSSLIPKEILLKVGLYDDSLFIDGVDYEWCWRARKLGSYRFFIDSSSTFEHSLGEGDRRLLFWRIAIPSPIRTYYQYRNYLLFLAKDYVPFKWKVKHGFKYALKSVCYSFFIGKSKEYRRCIRAGVKSGVRLLWSRGKKK